MKHLKRGKKFHRERAQRRAFLKSLTTSILLHGKIKTTEPRAKALRPVVERYITRAKSGTVASRRLLARNLHRRVVERLMNEIAPKFKDRKGGYLRITKLGLRRSDGAGMAMIELLKK